MYSVSDSTLSLRFFFSSTSAGLRAQQASRVVHVRTETKLERNNQTAFQIWTHII